MTKRFYAEGQIKYQPSTVNYFYTRDHLGSVREVTDNSGNVVARYDYDPYGRVTKVSGSVDSDFLYTGHYYHAQSGLHLAMYRAYDAESGRWLNRDPIGEAGGINLYGYVQNNPVNAVDPDGRASLIVIGAALVATAAILGFVAHGISKVRKTKKNIDELNEAHRIRDQIDNSFAEDPLSMSDEDLNAISGIGGHIYGLGKKACEEAAEVPATSLNMSGRPGMFGTYSKKEIVSDVNDEIDEALPEMLKHAKDLHDYLENHADNVEAISKEIEEHGEDYIPE